MTHQPLAANEFAALMARLGPFEARPLVAVAVSGGADSLALALLAHDWARDAGGHAVALTVDHRLRPGAAAEAEQVGRWLAARGMAHHVLVRQGPAPRASVQAAARDARYGLLLEWCGRHGALHLLLAHHREDQAETLLARLARGSGVSGLAAMAAVAEAPEARLLRPLLAVPKARLAATLRAAGQAWIDDPSNDNTDFGRVRLRRLMPTLAPEGLTPERLAATARRLGRARQAIDADVAAVVAQAVTLHPAGFARCRPDPVLAAPEEVGLRVLGQMVRSLSGATYAPRLEGLEHLMGELRRPGFAGAALGGCLVLPRRGGWLVCREPAAVDPPRAVLAGAEAWWDRRFRLELQGEGCATLGALGEDGWRAVSAQLPAARRVVPYPARACVPALSDPQGVFAVPHLGYKRPERGPLAIRSVVYAPTNPLAGGGHCLV